MDGAALLRGGLGARQGKGEGTAVAVFALHRDGFAVGFNDGFGDEHPQPHPGLIQASALIALVESVKDMGHVLIGDANAFVVNADVNTFVFFCDTDVVFAAVVGSSDGD